MNNVYGTLTGITIISLFLLSPGSREIILEITRKIFLC